MTRLRNGVYEVRLIRTLTGHTRSKRRVYASTALEAEEIALKLWRADGWAIEGSYANSYFQKEVK